MTIDEIRRSVKGLATNNRSDDESTIVTVRLSGEEARTAKRLAAERGCTVSDVLRAGLRDDPKRKTIEAVKRAIVAALDRL